jgi:putative ABC transport system permease protein
MTLTQLGVRNATQNKLRTLMTVLALAVTVVSFVALRTVLDTWSRGAELAAKDRLSTRNKLSLVSPLPLRYVAQIAERVPGVSAVAHCDWFGARWPKAPKEFFANMACASNVFDLFPEVSIEPAALARFKTDKRAAIIGDILAKQLGMKVGDEMTLESSLYPGDFRVHIVGSYSASPHAPVDRATLFFRWDYKNDAMPETRRDQIGWIFTRLDDAKQSAAVSRAIDALFDAADPRTLTMSERAANQANLGAVSAVFSALNLVSLILLVIMALILGNTLAMNVRERTTEYGVLRAIGFSSAQVGKLVFAEALALGAASGLLGLALAYPIVELGMGRWLEENMGKFFPVFRITPQTALMTMALSLLLALLAAALPARGEARLGIAEQLRRVA